MAKHKLTKSMIQKAIKEAVKSGKQKQLSDGQNLYLLLSNSNAGYGAWRLGVKTGSSTKWKKIGDFSIDGVKGTLSIDDARALAEKELSYFTEEVRVEFKDPQKSTIRKVWLSYLELKKTTMSDNTKEAYNKNFKSLEKMGISDSPIDISYKDVQEKLRAIVAKGKHATAKQLVTFLNILRKYASKIELVKHAPVLDINLMFSLEEAKPREALSQEDISDFFEYIRSNIKLARNADLTFLLLTILSACRVNEVLGFKQEERTSHNGSHSWIIPAERMKSDREHIIYESEILTRLLDHYQDILNSEKVRVDLVRKLINGYPKYKVTLHGFRATMSTTVNREKPEWERYISMCLAHAVKHASAVDTQYNRYAYEKEKSAVWQYWSDYLIEHTCISDIVDYLTKS